MTKVVAMPTLENKLFFFLFRKGGKIIWKLNMYH